MLQRKFPFFTIVQQNLSLWCRKIHSDIIKDTMASLPKLLLHTGEVSRGPSMQVQSVSCWLANDNCRTSLYISEWPLM